MKYLIVLILLSLITVYSCKKIEPTIAPPISYPNYSQLKVGNYWVYERFEIDTIGNVTPLGIIDTCYIEKDTVINGDTYFKYVRPPYYNMPTKTFIKDSLHYVVDNTGRIIFSSEDFNHVFRVFIHPIYYEMHEWMTDKDLIISVPLGNFNTHNYQQIFYMNYYQSYGNPRFLNFRYALNVGIVVEVLPFIFTDPNYIERRLVNYHIE